jgi:CRP/FNR family transcriptional regulator, cyclic AMP receptor protein
MTWTDLLGYAASVSVLASFCMSTMLPLRLLALTSNVFFTSYGFANHLYPVLILHVLLFPVNLVRLLQARRLQRQPPAPISIDASVLLPVMNFRNFSAGTPLFTRGQQTDRLFYIQDGVLDIRELGVLRLPGDLIGELGMFASDRKSPVTVICLTDCVLCELGEAHLKDAAFSSWMLRLVIHRLRKDAQYAAEQCSHHPPTLAAMRSAAEGNSLASLRRPAIERTAS